MSSTSRGHQRQTDDYYRTPARVVGLILPCLDWSRVHFVVDPAAGDGAIMQAVQAYDPALDVRGIELNPQRAQVSGSLCADAMTVSWGRPDLVVMNQPYSLAIEFCERALVEVKPGGEVAALMRAAMIASDERAEFWRKHPADIYFIKRPSFLEHLRYNKSKGEVACREPVGKNDKCRRPLGHDGECLSCGTDSCEYAWFVWGTGRGNRYWRVDA